MERKVIALCSVVGFLGLLCAATGFAAEATRFKGGVPSSSGSCTYPRTPAYGLGITAAVAMMIAQIITSAASRCTCCCSKGPHRSYPCWTVAIVCFVISWFGTVVAFLVLLGAAIFNDSYIISNSQGSPYFSNTSCPGVRSGVFAGGIALSLASVVLGIIYYLILTSGNKSVPSTANQDGVAMGQPQFPPSQNAPDPVFVHEDTYMRRQVLV